MKSVNLSSYNNSWYKKAIGASKVRLFLWYFTNLIIFKSGWVLFNSFKVRILRLFGASVGRGVVIKPSVNIKYPWKLQIGDYTWIGEDVWIDNLAFVSIGKNVCISQGAMLLTGNHDYKKSSFDLIVQQITLEDGAWIGAKSVVCPGVNVFSHAVLSVMSVATKDLEAHCIYQGNPAIKIKERNIT